MIMAFYKVNSGRILTDREMRKEATKFKYEDATKCLVDYPKFKGLSGEKE